MADGQLVSAGILKGPGVFRVSLSQSWQENA